MKATHFIQVTKGHGGKTYNSNCQLLYFLFYTLNLADLANAETVAVWRIKPTDVPLRDRLIERQRHSLLTEKEVDEFIYTRKFKVR